MRVDDTDKEDLLVIFKGKGYCMVYRLHRCTHLSWHHDKKNHLFHRDPSGIGGWWHKHNTCTNIVYQCITLSVFFLNPRGQEDQEMVSKISTWMWSKQLGMVLKTQEQNGKGREYLQVLKFEMIIFVVSLTTFSKKANILRMKI